MNSPKGLKPPTWDAETPCHFPHSGRALSHKGIKVTRFKRNLSVMNPLTHGTPVSHCRPKEKALGIQRWGSHVPLLTTVGGHRYCPVLSVGVSCPNHLHDGHLVDGWGGHACNPGHTVTLWPALRSHSSGQSQIVDSKMFFHHHLTKYYLNAMYANIRAKT